MSVSVTHTTRHCPNLPCNDIAGEILGESYELSLVFVGSTRGAYLNERTRGKTYVPNVLSFPLTECAGEIYITLPLAEREAARYGHTPHTHIAYLFIHGCLHLAGYEHGPEMERLETHYLAHMNL